MDFFDTISTSSLEKIALVNARRESAMQYSFLQHGNRD